MDNIITTMNDVVESKWNIFSLPAIVNKPVYDSCYDVFRDAFTSSYFFFIFSIGLFMWYLLDILGCYIHTHYISEYERNKIQKEQFAGHFIGLLHAIMISIASTLVAIQYLPYQALTASPSDTYILIYKYSATWSASYFLLDGIFITYYYDCTIKKKLAFAVHHFVSGICQCSVLLTHPIITYISALNFLIEWSTVWLNIRIFAKIWRMKWLYFIAGWNVIISYPFWRMGWNIYMIIISFKSEYLKVYTCNYGSYVLGGAEIFVFFLSIYYYLAVIMVNPKRMYDMRKSSRKPIEKDC